MGAIAAGGMRVLNQNIIDDLRIPRAAGRRSRPYASGSSWIGATRAYRGGRPPPVRSRPHRHPRRRRPGDRIDDGSGDPRAAAAEPARIVVAAPVGARRHLRRLRAPGRSRWSARDARTRSAPSASGTTTSRETTDAEVKRLLDSAGTEPRRPVPRLGPQSRRPTLRGQRAAAVRRSGISTTHCSRASATRASC